MDTPKGLFKVQLSLFRNFHVENANGLDPFMWWFANQSEFPNVGFFGMTKFGHHGFIYEN
jgi:hypothetical protein